MHVSVFSFISVRCIVARKKDRERRQGGIAACRHIGYMKLGGRCLAPSLACTLFFLPSLPSFRLLVHEPKRSTLCLSLELLVEDEGREKRPRRFNQCLTAAKSGDPDLSCQESPSLVFAKTGKPEGKMNC